MSRGTATLACLTLLCVAWDSAAGQGGSTSERSALAIRYEDGRSTDIHMNGTPLAPRLKGKAKVETDRGNAAIEIEFGDLPRAIKVAPGYATYVLWAITPDGRTENLGELPWRGDLRMKASLTVQRFALIVTAEPYSAVARPSPRIVSENTLKDGRTSRRPAAFRTSATTGSSTVARGLRPIRRRRYLLQRRGCRFRLRDAQGQTRSRRMNSIKP